MNEVINEFVTTNAFLFGEQAPLQKTFDWKTDIVGFDGGKEQRNQIWSTPKRSWMVNWLWMDKTARDKLVELYNRAKGRGTVFLYEDEDDYAVGFDDWFYNAVGGETSTQLGKQYYIGEDEEYQENKTRPKAGPTIRINNSIKGEGAQYVLDYETGIIDWTSGSSPNGPLGAGNHIDADYEFYYPVRFDFDSHLDLEFQKGFWRVSGLILLEVKE